MSRQTLAQQLIEVLRLAGVVRILGVVGESLHPVVDAVRFARRDRLGASANQSTGCTSAIRRRARFATAAEAQLTGRLAVCAGSWTLRWSKRSDEEGACSQGSGRGERDIIAEP